MVSQYRGKSKKGATKKGVESHALFAAPLLTYVRHCTYSLAHYYSRNRLKYQAVFSEPSLYLEQGYHYRNNCQADTYEECKAMGIVQTGHIKEVHAEDTGKK